jgi:adenosylcobinamide-phosphate synthase
MAVMRADARRHRSPNAGWPEAALAGALGCRLSGPRIYDEGAAEEPWLNGDAPDPGPGDVARGLTIYCRCVALAGTLLAAWALAVGLM